MKSPGLVVLAVRRGLPPGRGAINDGCPYFRRILQVSIAEQSMGNVTPVLKRIFEALRAAGETFAWFDPGAPASSEKSSGRGPMTELTLREHL